jgi:hypothetical protein
MRPGSCGFLVGPSPIATGVGTRSWMAIFALDPVKKFSQIVVSTVWPGDRSTA